jgi:hypothetical protein
MKLQDLVGRLKQYSRSILVILIFVSLATILTKSATSFPWERILEHPGYFFLAILLGLINLVYLLLSWWWIMNCSKEHGVLNIRPAYLQFGMANLSRYLPAGRILQFASFAHFSEDPNQRINSVVSFLILTFTGVMSGGIIGLFGLKYVAPQQQTMLFRFSFLAGICALIIFSDPKLLLFFIKRVEKKIPSVISIQKYLVSRLQLFLITIGNIIFCWIPDGLAALLILWMVDSKYDWDTLVYILSCYSVASFAGYLMVLAPAGLGVRDGLLAYLLSKQLPTTEAAFMSLGLRFSGLLAEVIFMLPLITTSLCTYLSKNKIKS